MSQLSENKTDNVKLKPMNWWESILWFGFWAVVLIISTYLFMPSLTDSGLSDFEKFFLVMTIPLALMFITAIVVYWRESNFFLKGILMRFRMMKFTKNDLIWGIGTFIAAMLGMGIFSVLGTEIISAGIIPIPKNLPLLLDPNAVINEESLNRLVGGQIAGNWKVLILYFIMLFFNIAGEELLWRGYILPRQELSFGNKTWFVHGIMWALVHSFKWWDIISLLPVCLLISYVAQKRKSIWPGFIAHYLINGVGFIFFFLKVIDVK